MALWEGGYFLFRLPSMTSSESYVGGVANRKDAACAAWGRDLLVNSGVPRRTDPMLFPWQVQILDWDLFLSPG
jgi:hypothetical protein